MQVAAAFVMSPPIRNKVHQDGLKAALVGGVLDIIATDHCPFNSTQKRMGVHDFRVIPNGVNGIEERMHMVWDTLVNPGMLWFLLPVAHTSTPLAKRPKAQWVCWQQLSYALSPCSNVC